jgi:predicted HD phosphohydrolase
MDGNMKTVTSGAKKDGDREEPAFPERHEVEYAAGTAGRRLEARKTRDGCLSGDEVTRPGQSQQSATFARRDGADGHRDAAALIRDIEDIHSPGIHGQYAAAILRSFLRAQGTRMVEKRGLFQRVHDAHRAGGDPEARQREAGHPFCGDCAPFGEGRDRGSFDHDRASLLLFRFEPIVQRISAGTQGDPTVPGRGARMPPTDAAVAAARAVA